MGGTRDLLEERPGRGEAGSAGSGRRPWALSWCVCAPGWGRGAQGAAPTEAPGGGGRWMKQGGGLDSAHGGGGHLSG